MLSELLPQNFKKPITVDNFALGPFGATENFWEEVGSSPKKKPMTSADAPPDRTLHDDGHGPCSVCWHLRKTRSAAVSAEKQIQKQHLPVPMSRADLSRDRWLQGPECWLLHHGTS